MIKHCLFSTFTRNTIPITIECNAAFNNKKAKNTPENTFILLICHPRKLGRGEKDEIYS